MNERIESALYNQAFNNNAMSIFCYKSSRKNALSSDIIKVNHLIGKDIKISDDNIINQFVGTLDKVISQSIRFNGFLELTAYVDISKNALRTNPNSYVYCDIDNVRYSFQRQRFYSIEQTINFLLSLYFLIYPYNEISTKTIYDNPSIKYLINKYYNGGKC